jgi:hypothetical protein
MFATPSCLAALLLISIFSFGCNKSPSLIVNKAVYGDLPNGTAVDVTEKVRTMVKNGSLSTLASEINFGVPFNGTMKLTITKAIIKFQYSYPADATETIKGFQIGNTLHTTGDGGAKFTVYYNYGDGKPRSTESGDDGSLNIDPPIKLRVDYTYDGVSMSKTVIYGRTLEINGTSERGNQGKTDKHND